MANLNLTKEQINLYSIIAGVVLLVCFFFLPGATVSAYGFSASASMSKMLFGGGGGFLLVIGLILAFLAPIYLILFCLKDKEALAPLKPIFVLDRKVTGIILAVAAVLVLIGVFATDMVSPGFGTWLYVIIAAGLCYLGITVKD
jgi:hypothetical protein